MSMSERVKRQNSVIPLDDFKLYTAIYLQHSWNRYPLIAQNYKTDHITQWPDMIY